MRAPEFWDGNDLYSRLLRTSLSPIGAVYNATVRWKAKHSTRYRACVPVICVGNISAGGTGKTPIAIAIAGMLAAKGLKPIFLSRGHGGHLRGPILVRDGLTAADVGDEPLLLARTAPVVVSRDRPAGARYAESIGGNIIVMDDGHQNFSLTKDLSLVVVDGERGFGNGLVLPAGPLRENPAEGLGRADTIVVMGDGNPDLKGFHGPVFRAQLKPSTTRSLEGQRFLAFAGIGYPQKFFRTVQSLGGELKGMVAFPDHHAYTEHDLARLKSEACRQNAELITTEKDFVRVAPESRHGIIALPVQAEIDSKEKLSDLLDSLIPPR